MTHKPQSFTPRLIPTAAAVLAVLSLTAAAIAQTAAADETSGDESALATDVASGTAANEMTAADVLEKARETLEQSQSLVCDIHQLVLISEHKMLAVGRYQQAGGNRLNLTYRIFSATPTRPEDSRLLEAENPPDVSEQTETGSLRQVSDGSVLWTELQLGESVTVLRRNLQEVTSEIANAPEARRASLLEDLGAGGLQTLMARLQTGMTWAAVRQQKIADTDVLVLSGRWSDDALKTYFGVENTEEVQLPPTIPDYVRIYVDAAAMLPRRIQYLKKHPNPEDKRVRPIINLDFRSIEINAPIEETAFRYTPPEDSREIDQTADIITSIKQLTDAPQEAENQQPQ